jgi:hypothetical protein
MLKETVLAFIDDEALSRGPLYVDVAVKRWQAFTGQKATLFPDASTFDEVAAKRLDSGEADPSNGPAVGCRDPVNGRV